MAFPPRYFSRTYSKSIMIRLTNTMSVNDKTKISIFFFYLQKSYIWRISTNDLGSLFSVKPLINWILWDPKPMATINPTVSEIIFGLHYLFPDDFRAINFYLNIWIDFTYLRLNTSWSWQDLRQRNKRNMQLRRSSIRLWFCLAVWIICIPNNC